MKIQIQWSTNPIAGWTWHDSTQWAGLPKKSDPNGGEPIDGTLGWIYALNVQGVIFNGDHYAIEHGTEFIKVYVWHDDPDDFTPDEYHGSVWTFWPTQNVNGQNNTKQMLDRFGSNFVAENEYTTGGIVLHRPWSEYQKPNETLIRHGIWVPDEQIAEYNSHIPAEWSEWIE